MVVTNHTVTIAAELVRTDYNSKSELIQPSTGRRGEACRTMWDISSNGLPWYLPIARRGRNVDVSSWWAGRIYFTPTECHVWIPFQKKAWASSITNIKWAFMRIDRELIIRYQSRIILYQRLWDGNPSNAKCWVSFELGFEGYSSLRLRLLVDQVSRRLDHVLDLLHLKVFMKHYPLLGFKRSRGWNCPLALPSS